MKRLLAILPVSLALGLGACASHTTVSNPRAQAATTHADKIISKCLPNPLTLASHAGREKFKQCAVPPSQQQAFATCLEKVALAGIPTKVRLKTGAEACLLTVN